MTILKKELTDAAIRKWKPTPDERKNRKIKWDASVSGFGVRATGNGKKVFILMKRFDGPAQPSPSPRAIGEYGAVSLEEARKVAREWSRLVKLGKDPAVEERRRREAEEQTRREAEAAKARADASTFAAAFELFATTHLSKLRTGKRVEQAMRRTLLPAWGQRPLTSLSRKDVSAVVYAIHDGGAPIAANRMLAYIKKFDKWAFNRALIDASFAVLMEKPAEEVERDRTLTNVEMRALWAACERMGAFGRAVRLLLATAARLNEVASMIWTEVDREAGLWTLPRSRTKTDREHKLPLSRLALGILDDVTPRGASVFTTTGRGPLKGWSKAKRKLDQLMIAELHKLDPQAILPPWRLHDLRRTAATGLAKLGADRVVISKILNHAEGGVTARYDRYGRDVEMVAGLDAWGAELERIAAESVVIDLAGRRA